ncbi:MAG: ComF family protein [Clostridia bacterium]|nr:ComF family protein [Clostridia bacterium]
MKKHACRLLSHISAWLDDLLFPQDVVCLCCDHALGSDAKNGVCGGCLRALDALARRQEELEKQGVLPVPHGIRYIHAAFVYEGQARMLIRRLKYESVRRAALALAQQMVFLPSDEEEIIVPVPTDKGRERKRGFNQSSVLARHIGNTLGMQVTEALVRVDVRRPQTGLTGREREKNLVGCMAASEAVSGKRVLLVDDVCTTGATLREAARALLAAGAAGVGVFTAARAARAADEPRDPFAAGEILRK